MSLLARIFGTHTPTTGVPVAECPLCPGVRLTPVEMFEHAMSHDYTEIRHWLRHRAPELVERADTLMGLIDDDPLDCGRCRNHDPRDRRDHGHWPPPR